MIGQQDTKSVNQIVIKPKQSETLLLGFYERAFPPPVVKITSDPDVGNELTYSTSMINDYGDLRLTCDLKNLSDKVCTVKIEVINED